MPNYLTTPGFSKGRAAPSAKGVFRPSFVDIVIDFEQIAAARAAAGLPALAVGDALQLLPLPRCTVVHAAGVEVLRAETVAPTATVHLGFVGGSPVAANAYANAFPVNNIGMTGAGTHALVSGTTDNTTTLAVTLNTAVPANARIRVYAVVSDVSAS